jgi:Glycosyltransferase like family
MVAVKNCPSAAAGLNLGLERAQCEFVVCVHQDVYLAGGWDRCLMQLLQEADRRFGPIGVGGVYGVGAVIEPEDSKQPLRAERIGWVVDRSRLLRDGPELPAQVATLDELLLVVRRDSGLRFDPDLGFHLYGADICLQARERGLAVVALGALCHHNPVALGCRRRFTAARRSSLANGAIAYRWPRRVSSSTATARSTPWITPRTNGRDRSLTPGHACDTRRARKHKRMFTTEAQSTQRGTTRRKCSSDMASVLSS